IDHTGFGAFFPGNFREVPRESGSKRRKRALGKVDGFGGEIRAETQWLGNLRAPGKTGFPDDRHWGRETLFRLLK
ncbi:MAG: hypothetical protein HY707_11200, partial [Ignavibacteriae bacterium]|nr:hypothetical protein [Ignavibacteriota bacterium]